MTAAILPRLDTYSDCLAFLFARNQFAMKLGLHNIENLLAELGNPHQAGQYLHVAGTNGKGSVCANLAALCGALGYRRVGLYTSPHLVSFRERIQVDGETVSQQWIVAFMQRAVEPILRLNATYFECVTAMALTYFRECDCGMVVLETGLGGRLDATNVVHPRISLITPVSLDHTEYLGGTVAEIFTEKLGIAKPGAALIHMETDPQLCKIAEERAQSLGSEVIAWKDFERQGSGGFRGRYRTYELPAGLRSEKYHYDNVHAALLALEVLTGKALPPEEEWMPTLAAAKLPGRLQLLEAPGMPTVLLDGAHNPEAIERLAAHVEKSYPQRAITFLFAIMRDKDYRTVLTRLSRLAGRMVYVTLPGHARALPFAELQAATLSLGMPGPESISLSEESLLAVLQSAEKTSGPEALVVICGSFYLLGDVIPLLRRHYPGLEFFRQFEAERTST